MTPIEITGIFSKIEEIAREYGQLTSQEHIRFAGFFGLGSEQIVTLYQDAYGEIEKGEVPFLACRDMATAVKDYLDEREAARLEQLRREEEHKHALYLGQKVLYEGYPELVARLEDWQKLKIAAGMKGWRGQITWEEYRAIIAEYNRQGAESRDKS